MEKIKLADIAVPHRMRAIDDKRINALAESMDAIGLRHPVSVREEASNLFLVAGLHRLKAAEALGWGDIPAEIVSLDNIDCELWEIDENLIRAELTPAERSTHLKRRKELWEIRESQVAQLDPPRPQYSKGFASSTSEATGLSKPSINRDISRAEKIEPDVMESIVGTEMDKGVELDALAKMEPEEQREAVDAVQSGDTEKLSDWDKPDDWEDKKTSNRIMMAYQKATSGGRARFHEWLDKHGAEYT